MFSKIDAVELDRRKKEVESMLRKNYRNSTVGRKSALKKVIDEFKEDLAKHLSVNAEYIIQQELERYETRYKKEYMRPVLRPTDKMQMPFCIMHRELTDEELQNMNETIQDIVEVSLMIFEYDMDMHAKNFIKA